MHQTPVALSFVTEGDADALADLRVASMQDSLERIGRFDVQRARSRFLSTFKPENTRQICIGQLRAGFVVVREGESEIFLDHLYIHPNFQARGLGTATLAIVLREADITAKPVRVGALKFSRSNDFYMRHGFRLVEQAEWDNYYVRSPGSDV